MGTRIALFLLIGLGFAGLAIVGFVAMRPAPSEVQAEAPVPTVRVIVAKRAVQAGNLLVAEDFGGADVPETAQPPGAQIDTPERRAALNGAMVTRSLSEGQPIMKDDALSPGDRGFLAAVLAPGTRAVTVGVDTVSGTAGLIWPGDRVDLILTQSMDNVDREQQDKKVSGETVLQDVRVIAVDQQLIQGGRSSGGNTWNNGNNRTVTLEVPGHDAEKVAVATRLGRLALVVRASKPAPDAEEAAGRKAEVFYGGDVSKALKDSSVEKKAQAGIRVFNGAAAPSEFKF